MPQKTHTLEIKQFRPHQLVEIILQTKYVCKNMLGLDTTIYIINGKINLQKCKTNKQKINIAKCTRGWTDHDHISYIKPLPRLGSSLIGLLNFSG